MDVAEQALTALEMLSQRHSKSILQAANVRTIFVLKFYCCSSFKKRIWIDKTNRASDKICRSVSKDYIGKTLEV